MDQPTTTPPPKASGKFSRNLKESTLSRYFAFSILYFGQGVPEGITFGAIPAWLAMQGVPPIDIAAYVAAIGLPWSFKIVLAPLMDRYTLKSMGRKRPWVMLGQLGLILSFISLSFIENPQLHINQLMIVGFIISTFGCFQDVATDGMAVDMIPDKEQARANGLMWGSKVLGYSATLAIGSFIINTLGFSKGVLIPALFTSAIILIPIFFRERRGEKIMPWTAGHASEEVKQLQVSSFKRMLKNLRHVFFLKSSLILTTIGFLIGIIRGFNDVVFPVFTIQELGWTNTDFANLSSSAYLLGGIIGMTMGGLLVDKFGKNKMLTVYISILFLVIASFIFYEAAWFGHEFAALLIGGITAFIVFINIAFFASCMEHCWLRVSATQFTLYMAIANLGMSTGSALVGTIKELSNWYMVFGVFALTALLALVLIRFLAVQLHKKAVEDLEAVECGFVEVTTQSSRF